MPIALRGAYDVPDTIIKDEGTVWYMRKLPKWAWVWDNDRDGSLGDKRGWWREKVGNPESNWNQYRWLALRNPANNLRHMWPFYVNGKDLVKDYFGDYRVDDDPGKGGWQFVWSGWRTGFYLINQYGRLHRALEIRTGWKLRPEPQQDKAVGFTVLIHPWRRL